MGGPNKTMNDPLQQVRETVQEAYYHAGQIPELQERGIQQLLLRVLNTTDDHL